MPVAGFSALNLPIPSFFVPPGEQEGCFVQKELQG